MFLALQALAIQSIPTVAIHIPLALKAKDDLSVKWILQLHYPYLRYVTGEVELRLSFFSYQYMVYLCEAGGWIFFLLKSSEGSI